MRAPLRAALTTLVIAACDPSIISTTEAGRPPDPLPGADAGPGVDRGPIPTCADGELSCNPDQTMVEQCMAGSWKPVKTCQPEAELCQKGACTACGRFKFTVETMQACSLSLLPGFEVDAESFITVGGQRHRVFAMSRWGKGHIVAWCDTTTIPQLLAAFKTTDYLGQTTSPRVASFGYENLCRPGALSGINLPTSITYLGNSLPEHYWGDPKALARDWDVIIHCGYGMTRPRDWSPLLVPFVEQEGKGLLAAMDYESSFITKADFDRMNVVTARSGIQFNPLNLPWAPASTEVVLDCVPDTVIK
jgi:hypothetical protein